MGGGRAGRPQAAPPTGSPGTPLAVVTPPWTEARRSANVEGIGNMQDKIEEAAREIRHADAILVSAGAGIGADSGLPDFRGDEGFWRAYPLLRDEGLSFADLANPRWFQVDPRRAWGFYGHRFNLYNKTTPHRGFNILFGWCADKSVDSFVFTSNVDGHFQKSGFPPSHVYECHGSINHLQCSACCHGEIWPAHDLSLDINEGMLTAEGPLPRCPRCSEVARPNILMFGDAYWLSGRALEQSRSYSAWRRLTENRRTVTIEIGAGTVIPTVRHESETTPGRTVRINPRNSDGCENTISIPLGALDAIRRIDAVLAEI